MDDDVSYGAIADDPTVLSRSLPEDLLVKFECFSYRNAAAILRHGFPEQYEKVVSVLRDFEITTDMIRRPGGSKGLIANYVDDLLADTWPEARISADLHVRLTEPKQSNRVIQSYVRENFLDGHRIDFVNGKVALDLEWNSKDQTYDRDLYAFSAFYDAGAIDVGIILTRGASLNNTFFRSLGKVLEKDGTEGTADVYKKFGASTTWMGKLLYRLDAGRNGGCPILAIGITPNCISDYNT